MKKKKNSEKKTNPSKARQIDVDNLEMSLKDESDGFYNFENELAERVKD